MLKVLYFGRAYLGNQSNEFGQRLLVGVLELVPGERFDVLQVLGFTSVKQ